MKPGPKQQQAQSRAMSIARGLIALSLAASFFATIAPLSSASANLMACCIGKAGHESGSCSTGLIESVRKPQPEPEVLCGQDVAPAAEQTIETIVVDAAAEDGNHCNLHPSSSPEVTAHSGTQSQARPTAAKSDNSTIPVIHALSNPCSAECASCSVSYTRRPRPREDSTPSSPARPHFYLTIRAQGTVSPQLKTLNAKWQQLRPRAPPVRFS